ncbi:ankyrin repeat domain-containing protein [Parapedobacter pyrenivorans]|uniref:ankyrin repeat domain-containing protein n=1 Tax=Parapedobacter pyrenivorans TaxID=1305674 RepID=UPI003340E65B
MMNIRHVNPFYQIARWLLVVCIAITTSCAGEGNSSRQADQPSNGTAEVPQVDIHTAVVTSNVDALRQHIAAGTDINAKDPFGGSSPLITAAVFGKADLAKILIEAGADLNFRNNDGSTALISAAFFGRPEIVQLLLDAGADKTIKNKYGATAYDTVILPFNEVKSTYDMMGKALAPMGLKLDYVYLEAVRPEIANMLQ